MRTRPRQSLRMTHCERALEIAEIYYQWAEGSIAESDGSADNEVGK